MILSSRILTLATLLVVALLSACQSSGQSAPTPTPAPQWETFHSDEGGFSVLFPATPEKQIWSDDQSYGGVYTSTYQGMTYNAIFNIMVAAPLPSDQLLQSLRDEHAAELKARLLSSDPIDFNGYPGLAYSLDAPKSKTLPDGGVVQGRIYHVNNRVYIIYHTGAKKNSLLPNIKEFLGSLKVDGMVELPTPASVDAGAVAAPAGWQEFISQEDGFSVLLPDLPERQVTSSDKTMETVNYFAPDGLGGYGVLSFNLKDPALAQLKPEALLDKFKTSIVAEQQGTVVSEKPIHLGPYPGYEILISEPKSKDRPNGGQIFMRLYLAGTRLYVPMALIMGQDVPPEVMAFLNSFNVIEPQ
jgi:hypothetical protein